MVDQNEVAVYNHLLWATPESWVAPASWAAPTDRTMEGILLLSHARSVLLTVFRAPPTDYNRTIVIARVFCLHTYLVINV